MKKIIALVSLLPLGFVKPLLAQFAQLELLSGYQKTDFSLYASHVFDQHESLSLATLSFFQIFHEKENTHFSEVGVQPTLFWNANKHLSLGSSLYYNSVAGYSKRLSVKYTVNNARLLIVIIPSVGYSIANDKEAVYAETFVQFQYNTLINKKITFCVNGQFLTVWNVFNIHSRSFQQLRTGVCIKGHQLGVGLDLDQYGSRPITKSSYGLYYRKSL
jgi:hypothetical protein